VTALDEASADTMFLYKGNKLQKFNYVTGKVSSEIEVPGVSQMLVC